MGFLSLEEMGDMDRSELLELIIRLGLRRTRIELAGVKRSEMVRVLLKEAPDLNPFMGREEAIRILAESEDWNTDDATKFVDTIIKNAKQGDL